MPHQSHRMRQAVAAASAVLLIALVAGCAPGAHPGDQPAQADVPIVESSDAPVDPSPAPDPTPAPDPQLPVVPGDEVVIVTATARAANGAAMELRLTAHYPHAWNSPDGEAIAGYLEAAGDTSGVADDPAALAAAGATLQIVDISAQLLGGGVAWPAGSSVRLELGPNDQETVIGLPIDRSDHGFAAVAGPGAGTAIVLLADSAGGTPDPADWANRWTYYGFRNAFGGGATLSDCIVDVTELARGSAGVEYWENLWDYGHLDCMVGIGH